MSIERRKPDVHNSTSSHVSHASPTPGKRTLTEQLTNHAAPMSGKRSLTKQPRAERQAAADPHEHKLEPREDTESATASVSVSSGDSKLIRSIKVQRKAIADLSQYLHKYLASPCDDTLEAIAFALDSLDGAGGFIRAGRKIGQALNVITGLPSPDCHEPVKSEIEGLINFLRDLITKEEQRLGYCV